MLPQLGLQMLSTALRRVCTSLHMPLQRHMRTMLLGIRLIAQLNTCSVAAVGFVCESLSKGKCTQSAKKQHPRTVRNRLLNDASPQMRSERSCSLCKPGVQASTAMASHNVTRDQARPCMQLHP